MTRRVLALAAAYLALLALNRAAMRVHGESMRPTYRPGDLVLSVPCHTSLLREGRVVVVEDPTAPGHLVVKRIHGVTRHGVDVRGDAPMHSTDSRVWGPVAPTAVRRLVLARIAVGRRARGTR